MSNSHTTRRTFLETVALGSIGMAISSCTDSKQSDLTPPNSNLNLGLQLWTFRDAISENLDSTIGRISELDIGGVETAFWPEHISLEQGAKTLKNHNIPVISVHSELPLDGEKDSILKMADLYDCDKMVWHGWPEDPRYLSYDGIHELAELYNESASWMKDQGLSLGLHNHWWEFKPVDDQYPFYMLLDHIDEQIFFEIDTYWAKFAGMDPAKVISDFGKRARMLHMKDGQAASEDGPMLALGTGVQDFPSILKASKDSVDWYIIEFDSCESDLFLAVEESIEYLNGLSIS